MPVIETPDATARRAPWDAWAARVPSTLSDHGTACCATARAWFHAMSRSMWRGQGGPSWIRRRYEWGPTCWPLHWCEAVQAKELCCGAQAALSVAAFRAHGLDAVPVQLVQRYEAHNLPHWHRRWERGGANPAWAADAMVYHEACAVLDGDAVRVWNPTGTTWLTPEQDSGYASIAAIRVGGAMPGGRRVLWGARALPLGEWVATGAPATANAMASPLARA